MSVTGLGDTAEVTRLRAGAREVLTVEMMLAPDEPPANPLSLDEGTPLPGLTVARINPQSILRFQLPMSSDGVVITDPGAYGSRVGLRAGDIILGINNEAIKTPADVSEVLGNIGRWMKVDLNRQGQRVSLRYRL